MEGLHLVLLWGRHVAKFDSIALLQMISAFQAGHLDIRLQEKQTLFCHQVVQHLKEEDEEEGEEEVEEEEVEEEEEEEEAN